MEGEEKSAGPFLHVFLHKRASGLGPGPSGDRSASLADYRPRCRRDEGCTSSPEDGRPSAVGVPPLLPPALAPISLWEPTPAPPQGARCPRQWRVSHPCPRGGRFGVGGGLFW